MLKNIGSAAGEPGVFVRGPAVESPRLLGFGTDSIKQRVAQ